MRHVNSEISSANKAIGRTTMGLHRKAIMFQTFLMPLSKWISVSIGISLFAKSLIVTVMFYIIPISTYIYYLA